MAKIDLESTSSGYQSAASLRRNFEALEAEFQDKVLYRDNPTGETNTLENDVDMNSNRILNLPSATSSSEPATFGQLSSRSSNIQYTGTVTEEQTATASQTSFTLLTATYTPGADNLSIFINGLRQHPSTYTETSTSVVTLSEGAVVGDFVLFVINERLVDGTTTPASSITITVDSVATDVSTQVNAHHTILDALVSATGDLTVTGAFINVPEALADSATPSVVGIRNALTGGTTTITDLTGGAVGQEVRILSEHTITITDGTNIFLAGSANFVMASSDSLTLVQKADTNWYEVSRSVN